MGNHVFNFIVTFVVVFACVICFIDFVNVSVFNTFVIAFVCVISIVFVIVFVFAIYFIAFFIVFDISVCGVWGIAPPSSSSSVWVTCIIGLGWWAHRNACKWPQQVGTPECVSMTVTGCGW